MNKINVLTFIQNIEKCGAAFINTNKEIIQQCQDYKDCIQFLEKAGKTLTSKEIQAIEKKTENDFEIMEKLNIKTITIFDKHYPHKLYDLKNQTPPIIYIRGNDILLKKTSVAIIGTRHPCLMSQRFEEQLIKKSSDLTKNVIISGLAIGCDKIAHETTLKTKKETLAVLPNGVNLIRPSNNERLAKHIIEQNGALISVFPINSLAVKSTYIRRDSIVAALSDAIFIIEAGLKSGTLYTAETAHKLNRPIACYIPSNRAEGDFSGNDLLIQKKYATKISSKIELIDFLKNFKSINQEKQPTLF